MEIDSDTIDIIENDCVYDNTTLCLKINRKLDQTQYRRVNYVLESAGGKWNRKYQAHAFPSNPMEFLDHVISTGSFEAPKDYGYFPTPIKLAQNIAKQAEIIGNMKVLEPSAGTGNLAKAIIPFVGNAKYIDCYEIQANFVKLLAKDFKNVTQADFLKIDPVEKYDRVVMNPPFAKQVDIDHVLHAFKFLKSGGMLISIMAAGVMFRDNKKTRAFRDFVNSNRGIIEKLPENSFQESGTSVNTVLVKIYKR